MDTTKTQNGLENRLTSGLETESHFFLPYSIPDNVVNFKHYVHLNTLKPLLAFALGTMDGHNHLLEIAFSSDQVVHIYKDMILALNPESANREDWYAVAVMLHHTRQSRDFVIQFLFIVRTYCHRSSGLW